MDNKDFKIISIPDGNFIVVILSDEMTCEYWNSLKNALPESDNRNADIYFDFLFRNGLKNRFFKTSLSRFFNVANSLKKCDVPEEYIRIADSFFAGNSYLIEESVLSNFQKEFYKKKISHYNKAQTRSFQLIPN